MRASLSVVSRIAAGFIRDALSYRSLAPGERHLFWKRLQAAAAFGAFPVAFAWGLSRRFLARSKGRSSRKA